MREIEFNKDLDEMNDAELRATLREFRTNYNEAKSEYDELQDKAEKFETDLEASEEAQETIDDLKPRFASMFAEMKDLDEEMVEDKFSVDELVEELEEADAFQLDLDIDDDVEDDVEDDDSKFSEREQKSRQVDGEKSKYQDRIDQFMSGRVVDY